jgi:hypothetical protein
MGSYQYQPLRGVPQEIRLVHLFPGGFEDRIKMRILHSQFPVPPTSPPKEKGIQVDSLRTLLSWPWKIEETEDGDIMMFNVVTGETQPIAIPTVGASLEETPEYQRDMRLCHTPGEILMSVNSPRCKLGIPKRVASLSRRWGSVST